MTDHQTVLELIVTTALEVAVPIESGNNLRPGLEAVISDIPEVRHVALEELGDVRRQNDHLLVDTYVRLTFHLDPESADDPQRITRDRLTTSDAVSSCQNFQIASGPYPIESW